MEIFHKLVWPHVHLYCKVWIIALLDHGVPRSWGLPNFKMGYGVFLIILMTFVSLFAFSAAYLDHSFGAATWIVRNEILFWIGASVIGWILGLALIRQAKRHEAMMEANLDQYERKRDTESTWTCIVRHEYFLHSKSGKLQEVSRESVHIYNQIMYRI